MSNHVDYSPYDRRSARNPATFNNVQTALVANSATVDGTNIAEEGIDSRVLNGPVSAEREAYITYTTAGAFTSASYITLDFGGAGATHFRTGTLALAANELWRIRSRVWLESTISSGQGLPPAESFYTKIYYQPGGGGPTPIGASERFAQVLPATHTNPDPTPHAVVSCTTWLEGSPTLSVDWISLYAKRAGAAGTCRPSKALLEVVKFRRVS